MSCLPARSGAATGVETSREISNTAMPAGGWVAWKSLGTLEQDIPRSICSCAPGDQHASQVCRFTHRRVSDGRRKGGLAAPLSRVLSRLRGPRRSLRRRASGATLPPPCLFAAPSQAGASRPKRCGDPTDETVLTGANASPCVLALAGGECQHTWRAPVPPLTKRKRAHGFQTVA